jgi:fibronectin-binding autotransporter adhesin
VLPKDQVPTVRWLVHSASSAITSFLVLLVTVNVCCVSSPSAEAEDAVAVPGLARRQGFQNVLRRVLDNSRMDLSAIGRSGALRPSGLPSHRQPVRFKPRSLVNDNWSGGTGNWSVAGNWSAGVPNNGGGNIYNVSIEGASDTVTLDMNATIASLSVGGASGFSMLSWSGVSLDVSDTLTVSTKGQVSFSRGSSLTTGGDVTNAGLLRLGPGMNTLTVNGTLTNNGNFDIGPSNDTTDVANVGTFVNNGQAIIGTGATLNLTNQPTGITDVSPGAALVVGGTLKAGAANGLANLGSVEGQLTLDNGQSTTVTPRGGTLTVRGFGSSLDLELGSTLIVEGNLSNSTLLTTNSLNFKGPTSTLTVNGNLTNNPGAIFFVGENNNTTDVANLQTLVNDGFASIGAGATLNLTNQPNGITDVVAGSELDVAGTLKAGGANGLAKLGSVEGVLRLENGQSTIATPAGGTLTLSRILDLEHGTTLTVAGNLTNLGQISTGASGGTANTLTVNGAFTNNGSLVVGPTDRTTDLVNVKTLVNNGSISIGARATLNLTNQPNGMTDLVSGTVLDVMGALTAGTGNGLAKLTGVEGWLFLENAQSTTVTPGGRTLTISGSGYLDLEQGTTLTVAGNVTNSAILSTNRLNRGGPANTLNVTGTLTNNNAFEIGPFASTDVANVGLLSNIGRVNVGPGATLNLTATGTDSNTSTVTLNGSTLKISGSRVTLGGKGGILSLSDSATNLITGGTPSVLFTNAETIEGSGTISNMGILNAGTILANQATPLTVLPSSAGLINKGILSVSAGDTMQIGTSTGGALQNFSGTTLTGGFYNISGNLQFGAGGTSLVTNAANITLTGAGSQIIDFGNNNILANFVTNAAGGVFTLGAGRSFTTAGNFTNNGTLGISTGDSFVVNGNLTNFSGTTLTGGTYNVLGTLQFNGAKIVTNAAKIILNGFPAKIVNQVGTNALLGLNTNVATGSLILGGQALNTTGGSFSNAGIIEIRGDSTLKIGGSGFNYTQTAGSTTVDGLLTAAGTGTLSLNGGTLFGGGTIGDAVVDSGTITPGDSSTKTGDLSVSSTYTQNANGTLDISIGGTTGGKQYDQLKVTGSAALNGTLNISRVNGFTPAIGTQFMIVNAGSLTGTFSTVNGLSINNTEHFVLSFSGTEAILTVVAGAPASPAVRFGGSLRSSHIASGLVYGGPLSAGGGTPLSLRPEPQRVFLPILTATPIRQSATFELASPSRLHSFNAADLRSTVLSTLALGGASGWPAFREGLPGTLNPFPNPAGMDHKRFECGVELRVLLKTSPKRLLKDLVADPDSNDAVTIGYMMLTPSH